MANFRRTIPLDEQFRRGWQHRTLARRLGREAVPDLGEVAEEFQLPRKFISDFALDNAMEIAAIRANPDDEFAGMPLAQRSNRAQELIDEVVRCNRLLSSLMEDDLIDSTEWVTYGKFKMALLEAIARELGQNKPALDAAGGVSFVINGIDLGALT